MRRTQKIQKILAMTPFWPKSKKHLLMGVINLTPDSFSDGGVHLAAESLSEKLKSWSESPGPIFPDFGAQSTAPKNQAISYEQEWRRLQIFLEEINPDLLQKFQVLSFDTYRAQTMKSLLQHSQLKAYKGQIIWNDVSGHFDDQVYELLLEHPNLYYIYTHNAVHSRELTPRHREFSELFNPKTITESVTKEFVGVLNELEDDMRSQVILDPGFGFAKDPETSRQILKDLPQLIQHFPASQTWLLGLSRKSMWQTENGPQDWKELDAHQANELERIKTELPKTRFIFRVHDPLPLAKFLL